MEMPNYSIVNLDFLSLFRTSDYRRRYSRSRNLKLYLDFCSLIRTFAADYSKNTHDEEKTFTYNLSHDDGCDNRLCCTCQARSEEESDVEGRFYCRVDVEGR